MMDRRQAAAIAKRKRDARVDRDLAEERSRTGALMGFRNVDEHDPDLVGWFFKTMASMKGEGHTCIICRPQPSLSAFPVYRHMLAATMRCTVCGMRLETVPRQAVTENEKK